MTVRVDIHPQNFIYDSASNGLAMIVSSQVVNAILPAATEKVPVKIEVEANGTVYELPITLNISPESCIQDENGKKFFRKNFGPKAFPGMLEKGYVAIPSLIVRDNLNVNYKSDFERYIKVSDNQETNLMKEKPPAPKVRTVQYKKAEPGSAYLPVGRSDFVPFGIYEDLKKVLSVGYFFPIYVTGLSGNGKTMTIGEVCASLGREMIRVNITADTDEDDLIGHYELINGETVWHEGPVTTAMKRGAVLLLDEVDLGTNRMMCLQPVLEGNQIFIKKTGETVKPADGFTVIATANTKGKGDETGNFTGTNVLNEAFLDRFPMTLHQVYPPREVEFQILQKVAMERVEKIEPCDAIFFENIINWANKIREGFDKTEYDDVVTTRRLVNAVTLFYLYDRDEDFVLKSTVKRFDDECAGAFLTAYDVIRKPLYHDPDQDRHKESRDPKAKVYKKNAEGNFVAS